MTSEASSTGAPSARSASSSPPAKANQAASRAAAPGSASTGSRVSVPSGATRTSSSALHPDLAAAGEGRRAEAAGARLERDLVAGGGHARRGQDVLGQVVEPLARGRERRDVGRTGAACRQRARAHVAIPAVRRSR